jgi:hypothetical protein
VWHDCSVRNPPPLGGATIAGYRAVKIKAASRRCDHPPQSVHVNAPDPSGFSLFRSDVSRVIVWA